MVEQSQSSIDLEDTVSVMKDDASLVKLTWNLSDHCISSRFDLLDLLGGRAGLELEKDCGEVSDQYHLSEEQS